MTSLDFLKKVTHLLNKCRGWAYPFFHGKVFRLTVIYADTLGDESLYKVVVSGFYRAQPGEVKRYAIPYKKLPCTIRLMVDQLFDIKEFEMLAYSDETQALVLSIDKKLKKETDEWLRRIVFKSNGTFSPSTIQYNIIGNYYILCTITGDYTVPSYVQELYNIKQNPLTGKLTLLFKDSIKPVKYEFNCIENNEVKFKEWGFYDYRIPN